MEAIGIRTEDFQLAYRLIKKFRDLNIPHIQLDHRNDVPSDINLWFGSNEEVNVSADYRGVAVDIDNIDLIVNAELNKLFAGPNVDELCFGVDTGPRPGLAWFADNRLIGSIQLEFVDDVIMEIIRVIDQIHPKKALIRIGNGPKTLSNRIINSCINQGLNVELVDEKNTSNGSRHDHKSSAESIAEKSGIPIFERTKIIPTRGEVREIQRISRLFTEGKITIPTELAFSVAIGNLSLSEAVEIHSK